MSRTDRIMVGQVLPEAEAETLRELRSAAYIHPQQSPERRRALSRYSGYLTLLRDSGWSWQAMATAVGVSRQAVQQLPAEVPPIFDGLSAVSMPPEREVQTQESSWSPPLPEDIRVELDRLRRASEGLRGPVRGTARENSPEARASAAFAALVNRLVTEQGYSVYRIATDLGLWHEAIRNRLAMWDYRPYPPSLAPKWRREAAS